MQLVRCVGADRRVRDVREVFFQDDPRYFELNPGLDEEAQKRDHCGRPGQPRIHAST